MNRAMKLMGNINEEGNLKFAFTTNSKDISGGKINWLTYSHNGPLITPIDDAPAVWDGEWSIKGDKLVVEGGLGEGGYGSVVVTLPLKGANRYYYIIVEPKTKEDASKITKFFTEHGYEKK